jgi:hypothetical protein
VLEKLFVGPREVLVLVLDGFLFAHSREEFVVGLRFLDPKNVMNTNCDDMK